MRGDDCCPVWEECSPCTGIACDMIQCPRDRVAVEVEGPSYEDGNCCGTWECVTPTTPPVDFCATVRCAGPPECSEHEHGIQTHEPSGRGDDCCPEWECRHMCDMIACSMIACSDGALPVQVSPPDPANGECCGVWDCREIPTPPMVTTPADCD